MGSPKTPTPQQRQQIEAASDLATVRTDVQVPVTGGAATVSLTLPREAVSLIELRWQ